MEKVIPKNGVIPMARTTKQLTANEIKNAKPKEKEYKLFDGGGLYLSITPKGKKWWRLKYRFDGKEKRLSLGVYPATSLQTARKLREEFKEKIAKGIDPAEERRTEKQVQQETEIKAKNTFKSVALEWLAFQKDQLAESTYKRYERALERDFYPIIGDKPIADVTKADLTSIAISIQSRGAIDTAHRLLRVCNQIWRRALQFEIVERNIVNDISKKDVLQEYKKSEFRTITDPKRIGELMRAIDGYQGEITTKAALQLLSHTFTRPANIRFAEWSEFDLKKKVWVIPAEKMKTKKEHTIPLSRQAIKIIKEIEPYTKNAKYVFHSSLGTGRAISENTLNQALKRLDFGSEIVSHGFRAMFSTLAYESGKFRGEVIEDLLAHKEKNKVKASYNRAEYEAEKRELMQWWADFLEEVKNDSGRL